jgi:hypothetical protein
MASWNSTVFRESVVKNSHNACTFLFILIGAIRAETVRRVNPPTKLRADN